MVRLVLQHKLVAEKDESIVSIPQWFDWYMRNEKDAYESLRFQSHNGSIGTWLYRITYDLVLRFQSHNGSIGTRSKDVVDIASRAGFNPTMVRLVRRQPPAPRSGSGPGGFNPTMVRLVRQGT